MGSAKICCGGWVTQGEENVLYQEQSKTGAGVSVTDARFYRKPSVVLGKVGANILSETQLYCFCLILRDMST